MSCVVAVDLGGAKTSIARVDERGAIFDKVKLPAARTLEDTVAQIAANVGETEAVGVIAVLSRVVAGTVTSERR